MPPPKNRQWILTSRPVGLPKDENFKLIETDIPEPGPGEVLVQSHYISVDPYMRPRMRNVRSYVAPLEVGKPIEGGSAGIVVKSNDLKILKGDYVTGEWGWQDYAVMKPEKLRKLEPDPRYLSASLGVLGMPGLTAYFALLDVAKPKTGETVVVSGAAGAVGSVAGQIAKIKGCRAVGIAGSDDKTRWLREIGFDAAINYKTSPNIRKELKDACPDGINVYFDNVGGPITDAAVSLIALKARIIICGQISLYNSEEFQTGPRNLAYLLVNRARMEGFLVLDYVDRYEEGLKELTLWVKGGRIKYRETIIEGLENAPRAFMGLFFGQNTGKQVVKVA
jgi:NADPH:quinone reductase